VDALSHDDGVNLEMGLLLFAIMMGGGRKRRKMNVNKDNEQLSSCSYNEQKHPIDHYPCNMRRVVKAGGGL
jgi:hypothetical protein